jgi:GNAT superfamily N-acetyltransferase
MELRPARADDIPACLEVFFVSLDELHARLGEPPLPRNSESTGAAMRHLVETDPDGCWLAEKHGRVIGFGLTHRRGEHWYLAFLFILPTEQSRGLGRQLLEACLGEARGTGVTRRSVVVEAIQPVSTALYAQFGMVPRVPLYVFTGEVRAGALPDGEAALASVGLTVAEFSGFREQAQADIDALDRTVVGWVRPSEHEYLDTRDRRAFLYHRGSDVVGYGYVQRSGRVGPICALDADHLLPITAHLLGATRPLGAWQVIVPGPAGAMFTGLLGAGLRIDGAPAVFCSSWDGPAFDRYVPMNFAYG